jgi:hypothetical protein
MSGFIKNSTIGITDKGSRPGPLLRISKGPGRKFCLEGA